MNLEINILIVDDDKNLLDVFFSFFQALGITNCFIASNREEVRILCQKTNFDIAFVDQYLENDLGTELGKELLELQTKIQIVLMSGYASDSLKKQAESVEIYYHLKKPILLNDFKTTIQELFPDKEQIL